MTKSNLRHTCACFALAVGIFGGSAYPIAKSEPKDTYTHFFYHADGSLEQEVPSYFTGGFFSSAKARVLEGPLQDLTYAGVMSQYYATILLPQDQSRGSTVYATRQEFPLTHEGNTLVPGVTTRRLKTWVRRVAE